MFICQQVIASKTKKRKSIDTTEAKAEERRKHIEHLTLLKTDDVAYYMLTLKLISTIIAYSYPKLSIDECSFLLLFFVFFQIWFRQRNNE